MQDQIITTTRADAKFLKRELEMQKAIREEEKAKTTPKKVVRFEEGKKPGKISRIYYNDGSFEESIVMPEVEVIGKGKAVKSAKRIEELDAQISNQQQNVNFHGIQTKSAFELLFPFDPFNLRNGKKMQFQKSSNTKDAINYAKQLGIKSYDENIPLDIMNFVNEALTDGKNEGYTMPDTIVVKDKVGKDTVTLASIHNKYGTLYLNVKNEYWQKPDSMASAQYNFPGGIHGWSTDNPKGILYHELGHLQHLKEQPESFIKGETYISKYDKDILNKKLSLSSTRYYDREFKNKTGYFPMTCREIVAEVRAALLSGKKLDNEVMEIYYRIINNEI